MSNINILMNVLFSATRQRALAVLLLQPDESFHLRELARLAGSHAGTLARELEKLVDGDLILRSEQGNQVRYRANRGCPLFDELASMFRKTHGVAAMLREALTPLGKNVRLALVFGSTAKGSQSIGSDIDLLVVGNVGFAPLVRVLHPLQESLTREINPVLYSAEEFRKRARRGEALLKNVTSQPVIFVKGDRDDLAELVGDPAAAIARR